MNKQRKTTKAVKRAGNLPIRDLQTKKDPKGGIIAILIGKTGTTTGDPDTGGRKA